MNLLLYYLLVKGFCMKKFELGRVLITPGAKAEIERAGVDEIELLGRHQGGDWSEMEIEDQQENEFSLGRDLRIFSSYTYKNVKFWMITEADRSATTILLPSEY
ncbi:MAG: hypothetical protein WKF90_15825 [Pyrinomonadaceae bacterium]